MTDHRQIHLGGADYNVTPLTIGQLRAAAPAFMRLSAEAHTDLSMAASAQILAIALHLSPEEVEAMPSTFEEVREAVNIIGEVAGLMARRGEPKPASP